jgi:NAD(P)-dependent dehydrogenase (short-subunit alcohol dehydrogenase family)
MAPNVQVNELALGAILPPADVIASQRGPMQTRLGPAGRMGTLDEVSRAVLSLIENDFITGETLHIDGGRHIR